MCDLYIVMYFAGLKIQNLFEAVASFKDEKVYEGEHRSADRGSSRQY